MLSGHNEEAGEHVQIVAGCGFSALGGHESILLPRRSFGWEGRYAQASWHRLFDDLGFGYC
jgi:hypothetical protein